MIYFCSVLQNHLSQKNEKDIIHLSLHPRDANDFGCRKSAASEFAPASEPLHWSLNSFNIFSPNGVTIKNNFEVKPGATLTIDPSRQFTGFDHPLEYSEPEAEE